MKKFFLCLVIAIITLSGCQSNNGNNANSQPDYDLTNIDSINEFLNQNLEVTKVKKLTSSVLELEYVVTIKNNSNYYLNSLPLILKYGDEDTSLELPYNVSMRPNSDVSLVYRGDAFLSSDGSLKLEKDMFSLVYSDRDYENDVNNQSINYVITKEAESNVIYATDIKLSDCKYNTNDEQLSFTITNVSDQNIRLSLMNIEAVDKNKDAFFTDIMSSRDVALKPHESEHIETDCYDGSENKPRIELFFYGATQQ